MPRIVLDPRYRGAGIAAAMLRAACREHAKRYEVAYIELATSMGSVNHFAESAGFEFVNISRQLGGRGGGSAGGGLMSRGIGDRSDFRNVYQYILDTRKEFDIDL